MIEEVIDRLWEDADHGTRRETVEKIWNAALDLAVKEVNKIESHSNTDVSVIDVINRQKSSK